MTLDDIVRTRTGISLPMIGADQALATDVQTLLAAIGVLDPPADGAFGPVSHWALAQVCKRLGIRGTPVLDRWLAQAMLGTHQWVNRHPDCVNVVYVEGVDADGTANDDAPNAFNDLRLILR